MIRGERAQALAERAQRAAQGDESDALVHVEESGFARFAGSEVHQPTLIRDESVTLRVVRDGKVGVAVTNRTDDDGLRAAATRAAEAADSSPPDPDFPGLPRPSDVPDVEGFDEATAALTPEDQAGTAARAIAAAPEYGLFGFFTSAVTETAVASSTGHVVSQAMTDASALAIAASDNESGYAEACSWKAGEIEPEAVAREAAEKARSHRRRDGDRTRYVRGRPRAVRALGAHVVLRLHVHQRARVAGGAELLLGSRRRADLRPVLHACSTTGSTREACRRRSTSKAFPRSR